jgi:arginase
MTRFVVVPQWQGSPAARAMLLVDGAEAIAGDLPRASCVRVEVPIEAGESLDTGIRRLTSLRRVQERLREALDATDDVALVVGGDCGVAPHAIAHAASRHPDLAVVWFDAHADSHSPASSPSGAFAGMALRAVWDDGPLGDAVVPPERVVLAGARELDPAERDLLKSSPVTELSVPALEDPGAVADAVEATGASAVYVHVDLDVLDPAVLSGVSEALPFGLALDQLTGAIRELRSRIPLAGASITGFAPSTPAAAVDDLGTILRIVGALA